MTQDRRTFLRTAGAAVSVTAAAGCTVTETPPWTDRRPEVRLDPALLDSVGAVVLPAELGADGRAAAIASFSTWAAVYEPVPELNHGYGTSEIRYGPPDPVPAWAAQLEGLGIEAHKRHGRGFLELATSERDALVRRSLADVGARAPSPLAAGHVALALLSHWLDSAEATDRCYGVRIGPRTCRGIEGAPREPEART